MTSVITKIDSPTRWGGGSVKLLEIYKWMETNVIDHWTISRLSSDEIKVDFFGLEYAQDAAAFKLKFGGYNG